ncbi:MAG: hypothetical protein ACYC18_14960 [Gammaproteobacteria bacterium]
MSLLGLEAIVLAVAIFLGGALIFEAEASIVVFAAGAARVAVILGLTVFVAFHVERLYDTREIEAILSRAISRGGFILSYWLGLVIVALLFVVPVAAFLAIFHLSGLGALWWSVSLALECCIVLAFALFAGIILERAIPTFFATAGFYTLARLVSFLIGIATSGKQNGINQVSNPAFDAISLFMPRLDLFCQTRWLVYGPDARELFFWIPLQAAIYIPLLLLMAAWDLGRKDF